ncbi:hypothetical protein ACFVIY_38080 [Streptomyces sp. NPDC127166]|uniref:hypothetical protein n=1 Tax=Streptomyces sp. NPDC127166 TaxID=3345380 RepID=UPI0036427635
MSPFPEIDPAGIAYRINLWSDLTGGVPVIVGVPSRPDLDAEGIEEQVTAFARDLATRLDVTITNIVRHQSASSELPVTPGA